MNEWIVFVQSLNQELEKGFLSPEICTQLIQQLNDRIESLQGEDSDERKFEIHQARIYQELLRLIRQQAEELQILHEISLNLTSSLDLQTVLEKIAAEAMRLVKHASTVNIFLFQNNRLYFGAARDRDGIRSQPFAPPRPNGLSYTVAHSGNVIIAEDMRNHPLFRNAHPSWDGSIIGIPLKAGERVIGVMNLSRSVKGPFPPGEVNLLWLLANQAALAIQNALWHQMVSQQAYTDALTGLPNRRALDEYLERELVLARQQGTPLCVIMMDLDGFKSINDTYGHEIGDRVLQAITTHIQKELRASDFLARYGGDELTLVLPKTTLLDSQKVTEKIRLAIQEFCYLLDNGACIKLSVSGGIAAYPIHALNASDLLRAADYALYRAKKYYRGEFLVTRPTIPMK